MPSFRYIPTRVALTHYVRRTISHAGLSVLILSLLVACQSVPRGQASFQRLQIIDRVPANGQLVVADLGGSTAADILLMNRQPGRLVWFENPAWQTHQIALIADALHGVAAYTPPGRVQDESVLPAGLAVNGRFSQPGSGTSQQLIWLQNPGRGLAQQNWPVSLISQNAPQGELLWADMTGTGRQILVTSPGLDAYTFPAQLSRPWGVIALRQNPLPTTRLRVFDWDLDGRDDLLVVGNQDVDIMALASRGMFVDEFTLLLSDSQGVETGTGFIDVGVGQIGRPAQRFVATLSASAQQLIVFRPDPDASLSWIKEIIDESLTSARVLKVVDLNRDAVDEIVVGDANGVTVFYYIAEQQRWGRYSLPGGVAIADIQIYDLTGTGFPDIVTAPAETGPVILFRNLYQK